MDAWILWIIVAGVFLVSLMISAGAIRKLYLGWRVPVTWISALSTRGWVQVIGKAKGEQIASWLSNSECVFWQLEVKEFRRNGKGGGYWKTVHKESSGPFEVDDMTGRIQVQADNCDLILNHETIIKNLDDPTRAKIENLGIKIKGFLGFDKSLRVHERTLTEGEEILVLGKFQKDPQSLSLSGGTITPLVISNMSKGKMLKTYFWRSALMLIVPLLIVIGLVIFYLVISLS